MRWFQFSDNTQYCLAVDIIDFARKNGYSPNLSTDGRVHPGSICNRVMRTVIKDPGLRRKFNITPSSVVQVRNILEDENNYFRYDLIEHCGVSNSTISKGHLDLYDITSVRAIIHSLIQNEKLLEDEVFEITRITYNVIKEPKSLEKAKLKPKASLF